MTQHTSVSGPGRRLFPIGLVGLIASCLFAGSVVQAQPGEAIPEPPEPRREFRGVWVATVANIDWPSEPGLPTAEAKRELVAILERVDELNLNAVVFQVRPAGDALYASSLEPWSYWLTGEEGRPPRPMWDPLAFAVEEAHARGIELHVWLNPFRADHPSSKSDPAAPALSVREPELVKSYNNHLWMDPGEPAVRRHSLAVVLDIVERYDIDGVHFDDYFYPYPGRENGEVVPFPDEPSWQRYRSEGGMLSRDDWRRRNVNDFVAEVYAGVKRLKPHVDVGISPFGIYRPGRPDYIRGFDQFAQLYADPLLWYRQGWLDYLTPQLYWPIAKPDQSFTGLLRWWAQRNESSRHLWPGLATYRHGEQPEAYSVDEFVHQVRWSRILGEVSDGHIHFSMKHLMRGGAAAEVASKLRETLYAEPALPPATPWAAPDALASPPRIVGARVEGDSVRVRIDPASLDNARRWVAQAYRDGSWHTELGLAGEAELTVATPGGGSVESIVVRGVDRFGRLSLPASRER